jgi:hypothetical protein
VQSDALRTESEGPTGPIFASLKSWSHSLLPGLVGRGVGGLGVDPRQPVRRRHHLRRQQQ